MTRPRSLWDRLLRNPITGTVDCCARAASGHAAAAPATSVMNSRRSFDNLVGEDVQLRRDRHPERVGCLAIDDQLEQRRLLNRPVGGLAPLENFVDQARGAPVDLPPTVALSHQSTLSRVFTLAAHRSP